MTTPIVFQSFAYSFAILCILIGLIGCFVPLLPGSFFIGLGVLGYAWYDGFTAPTLWWVVLFMLIVISTGSAEWWLPMLGAQVSGGSRRSTIYGFIGGIIGLFFGFMFGSLIGYALGVLLGSYQDERDWKRALKATMGGLAGQGVAAIVKVVGGLIVLIGFLLTS